MFRKTLIQSSSQIGRRHLSEQPAKLTLVDESNGIRQITLNSPKNKNALSMSMMNELLANIRRNENDENLRCIVLSSTGNVFSAGHNLKELVNETGPHFHRQIFEKCTQLMLGLARSPVPIIAKVDGLAAAAGCQLIASCDIVVATASSSFSTPGANFGIFCSTPGIAVSRAALQKQSLYMLLTGNAVNAEQAVRSGLITKCVADGRELDQQIAHVCDSIKAKSRAVIKRGKRFFYDQRQMTIQSAYKYGEQEMIDNIQMGDGQEGIKSFIEKRRATWTHADDDDDKS